MPCPAQNQHDCRLLWVHGLPRATCLRHWWRIPGITAATSAGGAR